MEKFRVNEIAGLLGVSQTTIYKKVKILGESIAGLSFKEKGVLFFKPEAVELFRASISTAPAETVLQTAPASTDLSRMVDLEKGIIALAESFRSEMAGLREDNRKLLESNRALHEELSTIRCRLEQPILPAIEEPSSIVIAPPQPIKAWSPVRVQPPVMPWYQRVWVEMFQPEALRVAAE